eukprot:PhM_4_TR5166/c5_g2_i1/m.79855
MSTRSNSKPRKTSTTTTTTKPSAASETTTTTKSKPTARKKDEVVSVAPKKRTPSTSTEKSTRTTTTAAIDKKKQPVTIPTTVVDRPPTPEIMRNLAREVDAAETQLKTSKIEVPKERDDTGDVDMITATDGEEAALVGSGFMDQLRTYEANLKAERATFLAEYGTVARQMRRDRCLSMGYLMERCVDPTTRQLGDDAVVTALLALETLRLSNCGLEGDIGEDLECFTELHNVYLDHNNFRRILPTTFTFMLQLTVLDLSYNVLAEIVGIEDLPLERLNISYNQLSVDARSQLLPSLPFESLRHLDVAGNPGDYESCRELFFRRDASARAP